MTVLVLLASLVGAALFFAAGFFIARDQARQRAEAAAPRAPGLDLKDDREDKEVQNSDADHGDRTPERALLARTTAEFKKVEAERAAASEEASALKKKLERLRSSTQDSGSQSSILRTQVSQLQLALEGADSAKTKLMAEISRLKSELMARVTQQSQESGAAVPMLPVGDLERDGGSVEHYLERLCERGGARGAVVADSSGLVVSGAGLGTEALAALAASTYHSGSNAADLVSMGPLSQVTLSDGTDLTFTALPFQIGGTMLILATLSTGAMARETVAPVMHRAAELLD
jgi:predicted regulator of Ras-like GTPase activity (Roadblock/LC7/MglB family)